MSTALSELSDSLAAAVERAAAFTVLVSARRRFPASGIAWSADGVIVTADHVLEREDKVEVVLPSGERLAATIAGRDPGSDVAALRVPATLAPAEPAPDGAARVGSLALALGRPTAEGPMASFGVISAVGGPWRTFRGTEVEGYIRPDTTFYPGFSGGPLIDVQGRALGMNSSRLGRGSGLTIPSTALARIVSDLLTAGRVRRAYLGISSQVVRLPAPVASTFEGRETGLLIVSVEPGSPADAAGLMVGDILVTLASVTLADTDDLQAALSASRIGQPTPATVVRAGELRDLTVTPGERA